MSLYMVQVAYTSESWKHQVNKRENPLERVGALAEAAGGRLVNLYYSFGEYDIVGLMDMPNEESAAAFSLAANAGGSESVAAVEDGNELRTGELWPWLWLGVVLFWLAEGVLANRTVA